MDERHIDVVKLGSPWIETTEGAPCDQADYTSPWSSGALSHPWQGIEYSFY
ncbi:hypothetical protein [Streptomyces sp. NPDC048710]|uniref:hypothetical protein n=1 Tax=Streptomyces sp. NPDC048710 TaxID=3365586 RepID=UPI00371AB6B2